jgi:hypothetical protein
LETAQGIPISGVISAKKANFYVTGMEDFNAFNTIQAMIWHSGDAT